MSEALEITTCLFMNLDLAPGIEEVLTRDVLEEHLSWWKGEIFLVVKDSSSLYQMAGQGLSLSYSQWLGPWLDFVRQLFRWHK